LIDILRTPYAISDIVVVAYGFVLLRNMSMGRFYALQWWNLRWL